MLGPKGWAMCLVCSLHALRVYFPAHPVHTMTPFWTGSAVSTPKTRRDPTLSINLCGRLSLVITQYAQSVTRVCYIYVACNPHSDEIAVLESRLSTYMYIICYQQNVTTHIYIYIYCTLNTNIIYIAWFWCGTKVNICGYHLFNKLLT